MKSINAVSPVEAQKDQKTRYFYHFRPDLLDLLDLLDFAGTRIPLFCVHYLQEFISIFQLLAIIMVY